MPAENPNDVECGVYESHMIDDALEAIAPGHQVISAIATAST